MIRRHLSCSLAHTQPPYTRLFRAGGSDSKSPPPVLAAATGVTATAQSREITISWTAVSGAASYNLYYAKQPITDVGNYAALDGGQLKPGITARSEEHTSELQSLMRRSHAVFRLPTTHLHTAN